MKSTERTRRRRLPSLIHFVIPRLFNVCPIHQIGETRVDNDPELKRAEEMLNHRTRIPSVDCSFAAPSEPFVGLSKRAADNAARPRSPALSGDQIKR